MAIPAAYPLHEVEILTGGNTNTVLRRGNEVIRPAQPGSATIQALLAHLRRRGIT